MNIPRFCFALFLMTLFCAASALSQSEFASADCSGQLPAGYTRMYIADRHDGKPGSGSASDPFDGSTAQKFDSVLRAKTDSGVTHLIVCIGPGTFMTDGTGNFVIDGGRGYLDKAHPTGFTVNDHWRIHGASMARTILRLAELSRDPSNGKLLYGVIIGTHNFDASGIEVSDMTLGDAYPTLKPRYHDKLQLMAVALRSSKGHQWIHDLHVMNAAGEVAEAFPVSVTSPTPSPENQGNLIEHVSMDLWHGGQCTAIAISGGGGEIRNNKVVGYNIGYGGWSMTNVNYHDNVAIDTPYGFNIDSWENKQITIAHNEIIHPKYGIVIGGNGNFHEFSVHDNTITAGPGTMNAVIFQGHVKQVQIVHNKIRSEGSNAMVFLEKGAENSGNTFEENEVPDALSSSLQGAHCAYKNVNESGRESRSLRSTQNKSCQTSQ